MSFLQMSFTGAVFILAATVIRALAINRLPKKTFLALWGIALMRLLLPFSLPSVFSLYSVFGQNAFTGNATNASQPGILRLAMTNFQPAATPARPSGGMVHLSIWSVIWAAGVFICAMIFSAAYWKCYREFRISLPADSDFAGDWLKAHKLKRSISVRQSARISSPLTYGVLHPIILMPKATDWEDEKTIQYVLAHEYIHIKRFDTLAKLILIIVLCVHWFNPAVWLMYMLANRDIELVCDETVICMFGEKEKSSYARMLISMEEARSGFISVCNNFSKNSIEERIIAIMKMRKNTRCSMIMACAVVAGTTAIFATSANASGMQATWENVGKNTAIDDSDMTETALLRLEKDYPDVARWVLECYPDTVWWTYEGYKTMMETERQNLEGQMGNNIGWTPSAGNIIVTAEFIDEQTEAYEQILAEIQNGIMVSKSVGGSEELGGSFDPADIASGMGNRELQCSILLEDGTERIFGPYETEEEMLSNLRPFCEEQIKSGHLSQHEADELMKRYAFE